MIKSIQRRLAASSSAMITSLALRLTAVFALSAALLLSVSASAIVIRHDRADSRYIVDAQNYPQLFFLQERNDHKVCLATLIGPRWAITAGHCVEDTPVASSLAAGGAYSLGINGAEYQVSELVLHPQYSNGELLKGVDLALLQLDRDVDDVVPVRLNREQNEASKVVSLLGWGYTGIGSTGRRHNDGKLRRAQNVVEDASLWLHLSFDDPRDLGSGALALEGVPGLGDSGGPALLETEQGPLLLGVAVGELWRGEERGDQGLYGATEVYERISLHLDWIDTVTGAP